MEDLRRLAAVHTTLQLLMNTNKASNDDLLLAEFLLYLVKNCTDVEEFAKKCSLLSDKLSEICNSSINFEDLFQSCKNGTQSMELLRSTNMNGHIREPSITLRAFEKARSTLEDFCRSYFMFHDMNAQSAHDLFKHLPILAFVESYIYQIDEQNEESLLSLDHTFSQQVKVGGNRAVQVDDLAPLRSILAGKKLLTRRWIEKEMDYGAHYWTLEQSLCSALLADKEISLYEVMRAANLKSFDYRVLNLLLYGLTNREVNELHMEFLSVSEFLVEISDDLFDYEEDVVDNSFNILRMFLKIYGPSKAPCMLVEVITEAEEKYNQILEKLSPPLSSEYRRRCQEAAMEGGSSTSYSMGSWTIPPLIVDERAYRQQMISSNIGQEKQD